MLKFLSHFKIFRKKTALERYQSRLVMLLSCKVPPDVIKAILLNDPRLKDYHDYIRQMDEAYISVASELVTKWSNRAKFHTQS